MTKVSDYSVVVKELDGQFYCVCKTLGILTHDIDLAKAFAEMRALQTNLLERFQRVNLTPPLPSSNEEEGVKKIKKSKQSIVITLVIALLIIVSLMWASISAMNSINFLLSSKESVVKFFNAGKNFRIGTFTTHLASKLQDMNPEKKEEFRENLRIIVKEITPFVDELRPLVAEPQTKEKTKD